jgi:hypothetical protein
MKPFLPVLLAGCLIIDACAGQNKKIIIQPAPAAPEQPAPAESAPVIESRYTGEALPEWADRFFYGGIPAVEALDVYRNKYAFIGKNQGTNFNALEQWAENFSEIRDFPRLVVARIEKRLIAAATLYPDDEYGEYFETLIKTAADAGYPGAVKENIFWIKRRMPGADNADGDNNEASVVQDIYEFFVLISIDKNMLQTRIRGLAANIHTAVPPTRAQRAAINRVQQNFFEGF